MTLERYGRLRREAGVLKMRGLKLRALGGDDEPWQSVVAFHEAARKEIEAFELLEAPSPETEAAARIEACGLFLDARDLESATVQWGLIPESVRRSEGGEALLAKLAPVFGREHAAFVRAWQDFKKTLPRAGSFDGAKAAPIRKLCADYPGVAGFWWMAYRHADARERWGEAKAALQRARQLDPENVRYVAMDVYLNPFALDRDEALEACREDWRRLRGVSAEVNQMFALALLKLSRGSELRAEVLDEIVDAARRAEDLAGATGLGRQASVLRRYVEILRQGRAATVLDFARVGIASVAAPGKSITVDELEDELIERCRPYNDNAAMPMAAGF